MGTNCLSLSSSANSELWRLHFDILQLNLTYFRQSCPKGVQFSHCLQCFLTSPKRELIPCFPISTQIAMLCEVDHNHQSVTRNNVCLLFFLAEYLKTFS